MVNVPCPPFEVLPDLRRALSAGLPAGTPSWRSGSRRVWDVLLDDLTIEDVRPALAALASGAGEELSGEERGQAPFLAPWSSALMAVNFLAPFGSRDGLFDAVGARLTFEHELRVTGVRSRVGPTTDAVLHGAAGTIVIEAKVAEPWRGEPERNISGQYDEPATRVSPGALGVVDAIRKGSLGYMHLDAAQLVKHLLGIHSALEDGTLTEPTRLVLLYWCPSDTGRHTESFERLEDEFIDFAGRLEDQPVTMTATSTSAMLHTWSGASQPAWLRQHAAQLRFRYDRPLPS